LRALTRVQGKFEIHAHPHQNAEIIAGDATQSRQEPHEIGVEVQVEFEFEVEIEVKVRIEVEVLIKVEVEVEFEVEVEVAFNWIAMSLK
jgi:hypothetical protein